MLCINMYLKYFHNIIERDNNNNNKERKKTKRTLVCVISMRRPLQKTIYYEAVWVWLC